MTLIRATSNAELKNLEAAEAASEGIINPSEEITSNLAGHIREAFQSFKAARMASNLDNRIQEAIRTYNGQYSLEKLAAIKEFGGSEVYSRLTTVKCRGTTAMLRDIFLGNEQPWALKPTSVPEVPQDKLEQINSILAYEIMQIVEAGQQIPDENAIRGRRKQLEKEVKRNIELVTQEATQASEKKLQDILEEGGFYQALSEFLIDLPIYPFAAIKGPVIRMAEKISWENGKMVAVSEPKMFWERVDPINLYYTPGASRAEDADMLEKIKLSRSDLSALIGVKGYNEDAIRNVLNDYDSGLVDWLNHTDTEYADEQGKENPQTNRSQLIDGAEYSGYVKGETLLEYGVSSKYVVDPDIDYAVTCWLVGRYVIKVVVNQNPRRLHNYYLSSFEKIPGAISGHGLPEIINDIQDVANAALRSLTNNMSIASGPQVAVNEDLLSPGTDPDTLYPWKRWKFNADPMGQTQLPPISFFQPKSNANELLGIYQSMATLADEISAIPRYMTGSSSVGGAGSTASGLSMLMNNASKVLQNIAANIDRDIMMPSLQQLYMTIMLSDTTGILQGDEEIVVQGVSVALQRETDRMRQLEFLNMTNNEVDLSIIGKNGRAAVLRAVSNNLGMPGTDIVPNAKALEEAAEEAQMQQMQQMQQTQGGQPPQVQSPKTAGRVSEGLDNAQRVRSPATMMR